MKIRTVLKNLSYTISSNFLTLIFSLGSTILIPSFIGIGEYGFWQLYVFYTSYVFLLGLGLSEGIYLRQGGKHYEDIKKDQYSFQFWLLVILEVIISIFIAFLSKTFIADDRQIIILFSVCTIVLIIPKTVISYTLQCTNRIKEYAFLSILEKSIMVGMALVLIFLGYKDFQHIIYADLIGKLISLGYACYSCKSIVFIKPSLKTENLKEFFMNINVGSKLLLSSVASMLVLGVVKFAVEINWDIETFGKMSLSLSLCNMLLIFINSIGTVFYPLLKKEKKQYICDLYCNFNEILILLSFLSLVLFYPAKNILNIILPNYKASLEYLGILFPICVFESKTAILVNTYLKALRLEKALLLSNIMTVIFSIIITFISVFIFDDIILVSISIVIILAFKSCIGEYFLSLSFDIKVYRNTLIEIIMSIAFIISNYYFGNISFCLYSFVILLYIILFHNKIFKSIRFFLDSINDRINY